MSSFGNDSILTVMLDRIRSYIDDPATDAKYNDAWILSNEVGPAMNDLLQRMSVWDKGAVELPYQFTAVEGQRRYSLPPAVLQATRLLILDEDSEMVAEVIPRGRRHPSGFQWCLEHNELIIDRDPTAGTVFELRYIHNGDMTMHKAEGLLSTSGGVSTMSLGTPATGEGVIDRREKAYCGHVLRIIPASGPIESRLIASHVWESGTTTWSVTTHRAFTDTTSGSDTPYEIIPIEIQSFWEAVVVRVAIKMAAKQSVSQKKMAYLRQEFMSAMKTVKENRNHLEARTGHHWDRDQLDDSGYNVLSN